MQSRLCLLNDFKSWWHLFIYLSTLLTWFWTIIPAAKCLGGYLPVIGSSLFFGHCPANHFQCVNSPVAFSGSTPMMRKTIRTCCLNRYIMSTTIAIPFSYCFWIEFFMHSSWEHGTISLFYDTQAGEQINEVNCPRSYRSSLEKWGQKQ